MLFRDANDFLKMFLLLDRIEHECRNRVAGHSEAHLGRSVFPASIGRLFFLGETGRTSNRPVKTAAFDDFFHGKRITHVVSQDEPDDAIGNTWKMRGSRKYHEPFHARAPHRPSRRDRAVAKN